MNELAKQIHEIAVIRLLDLCVYQGIDIEKHIFNDLNL